MFLKYVGGAAGDLPYSQIQSAPQPHIWNFCNVWILRRVGGSYQPPCFLENRDTGGHIPESINVVQSKRLRSMTYHSQQPPSHQMSNAPNAVYARSRVALVPDRQYSVAIRIDDE